jgi:hypothetical protein
MHSSYAHQLPAATRETPCEKVDERQRWGSLSETWRLVEQVEAHVLLLLLGLGLLGRRSATAAAAAAGRRGSRRRATAT